MTALYFLKDYWYVPLLIAGAVLLWILWPKKPRPDFARVQSELEVIRAGAEARKVKAELGAEKAAQAVKEKYRVKEEQLNEEAKQKAADLERDPVALARHLERASR